MGEVIRFVPKAELERDRLIRRARAMYDRVFPPAGPANAERGKAPADQALGVADAQPGGGVVLS
jgi:hypothetical protein